MKNLSLKCRLSSRPFSRHEIQVEWETARWIKCSPLELVLLLTMILRARETPSRDSQAPFLRISFETQANVYSPIEMRLDANFARWHFLPDNITNHQLENLRKLHLWQMWSLSLLPMFSFGGTSAIFCNLIGHCAKWCF